MSDTRVRALLWIIAVSMAASIALFALDPPYEEPKPLPHDSAGLATRLLVHPTDWQAASALAERALDDMSPRRIEAWHAAYSMAQQLAPHSDGPRTAFVRDGLFHWYELGEGDRRTVLVALDPLMRDPMFFFRLTGPFFYLTGNVAYLRRVRPQTLGATETLGEFVVMNGRFADYHDLRAEAERQRTREFLRQLDSLPPSQIIAALPAHPTTDNHSMIVAALQALHNRPLEVDSGHPDILGATIEYAVRHGIRPLDGLAPAVREQKWALPYFRAMLARALGQPAIADEIDARGLRPRQGETVTRNGVEWDGVCGPNICHAAAADITGPLSVTLERSAGDEVPPYAECYVDDALAWEGPIAAPTTIALVPAGRHRVEIRLVNPLTRNHGSRMIRIV
jgi:hypothetical protein